MAGRMPTTKPAEIRIDAEAAKIVKAGEPRAVKASAIRRKGFLAKNLEPAMRA